MTKVKIGLLVGLVVCSLVLSALIIFGAALPRSRVESQASWFGSKPGLNEVCLPARVYICDPEGETVLIEALSRLYTDLVLTLSQMEYGSGRGSDWVAGEFTGELLQPGVLFRYDYEISRGLLSNWLTRFYETDFPFPAIDSVFVPLDGSAVRFINTGQGLTWRLRTDLPLTVFQQAAEELQTADAYPMVPLADGDTYTAAAWVFDLAEAVSLTIPTGQPVEERTEDIVHSFFPKPSIIREMDGTVTFTDGFGAMRVYPAGLLEYTAGAPPQGDSTPNQLQLMQLALDFLYAHGGWPGNLLPGNFVNRPTGPAKLEFVSFVKGLPIAGENIGLSFDFQRGQVSAYRRKLLAITGEAAVPSIFKPLAWNLASDSQVGLLFADGDKLITDLAPMLYWQTNRLIPVWRIETKEQVVYAAANDGRVLRIKTQLGGP